MQSVTTMRTTMTMLLTGALLALAGCSTRQGRTDAKGADAKPVEYLFVQTAHGVTFDGDRLTLHDVSPSTLFFSDRPERITGHQDTAMYVANWSAGDDSFAADPPNAALSMLGDDQREVAEVVVELRDPRLVGRDLSYAVTVLDGAMPARAGVSTLFVDAVIITNPVVVAPGYGPASYRGQARRVARRTSRRVAHRHR